MLVTGFAVLVLMGWVRGVGPSEVVVSFLDSQMKQASALYEQMGLEDEKAAQTIGYVQMIRDTILRVYPALLTIGTGLVVWLNMMISKPLFRFGHIPYPEFGALERWKTPDLMIWGVIASGFSLFLPVGGVKSIAVNGLIVMLTIYVFHGLAILLFYLKKFQIPSWIRGGIYCLIVFQQIVVVALALAGLFDQWIDFRRMNTRREGQ